MGLSSDEHRAAIKQLLSELPPPLHDRAICKGCPHPQECRNKPCLNDLARPFLQQNNIPSLMLPAQAVAFEVAMVSGRPLISTTNGTPKYGRPIVSTAKLNRHFSAYPLWAARMRVMMDANHRESKGQVHRIKDGFCRRGHALPEGPNQLRDGKWYRRCTVCAAENKKKLILPADVNVIGQVIERLLLKHTINSFTSSGSPGYLLRHVAFKAVRAAFPVVDKLALEIIEGCHKPKGAPKPFTTPTAVKTTNLRETALTGVIAAQPNDIYTAIIEALPANLPEEMRMEMISEMYIAVDEGRLGLGELKSNLKGFKKQYNAAYPGSGRYAQPSLDAPAYRDGPTPLVETISESEGLW